MAATYGTRSPKGGRSFRRTMEYVYRTAARRLLPAHVLGPAGLAERPGVVLPLAAGAAALDDQLLVGGAVPERLGLGLDRREIEPDVAQPSSVPRIETKLSISPG